MDEDLKVFLGNAGLKHLINKMLEDGMTLEVLLQANENELALLTTKVVEKIKLRSAIEKLRNTKNSTSLNCEANQLSYSEDIPAIQSFGSVALPVRQDATLFFPCMNEDENENYSFQNLSTPSTSQVQHCSKHSTLIGPSKQQNILSASVVPQSYSDPKELSYFLEDGYEFLGELNVVAQEKDKCNEISQSSGREDAGNNLRSLLSKETIGKFLLQKAEKGQTLNPRDRAFIVKVVVEVELRALDQLNHTIRKDVWLRWANEIAELFKGESRDLYYVPYHIVGGKVIQASGLIHYRLITHRRTLTPMSNSKKRSSSSDSDCSTNSSYSGSNVKRVRPLPDGFKVNEETSSSLEEQLDWLRGSSSPYDAVLVKWRATLELRNKFLESHSYLDYFTTFPALRLPNGYQLLSSDFESVYPGANKSFEENFPIVKLKLLKLLAEKGESSRADQATIDLLQLASLGEEQANVAALLGIVNLLRQMTTISIPKKKIWKLTREEARNGFLARVATPSEIETYCLQREILCTTKGIPNQPFILAIGPAWSNISQYEIVINKGLRFQLPNVCSAVMHTFNLYWALDCAYPKESAQCWMVIQRAIFQIKSKFDVEGVPLRELLQQLEVTK